MRGNYMLSAVTKAVKARFPEIKVYNERAEQKAGQEFLFVSQINRDQSSDFGNAHNRFYFFDVRYHPDDKKGSQNKKITEVEEGLFECLFSLETDDQPVKAARLYSDPQDGVLHFFADYPVRVRLELPKQPEMKIITVDEQIKKE